jgi:putative transposase
MKKYPNERAGLTTSERERIQALEREVRELRQAERNSAYGLGLFCPGGTRPPIPAVKVFFDEHRDAYGVEPIC